MDVTLTINGRDFSPRLSTYKVQKAVSYGSIITTMDGVEHAGRKFERYSITFSMFPFSNAAADYSALAPAVFSVTFTDPNLHADVTRTFRVTSNLNAVFGLRSSDGNSYYKGGEIVLRALEVN